MTVVTYSYARQNLAKLMAEVERDRAATARSSVASTFVQSMRAARPE